VIEPRLLIVAGSYWPDIGGAELSVRTAAKHLLARGWRVLVISDWRHSTRVVDGIQVLTARDDTLRTVLESAYTQFKPRLLAAQGIFSRDALIWAHEHALPTVYFVRAPTSILPVLLKQGIRPTRTIANAEHIARELECMSGMDAVEVVHPLIDIPSVLVAQREARYVTMVNPVLSKGGDRFSAIAHALPTRDFLAVRCWTGLRDNGTWTASQWRRLVETDGADPENAPVDADFTQNANVTVWDTTPDCRTIYRVTRLLLFPSRWREPFGRVIIEAQANGIPVISAPPVENGNLPVAACTVSHPDVVGEWVSAIERLDDVGSYLAAQETALAAASQYSLTREVERLDTLLRETMERGNA